MASFQDYGIEVTGTGETRAVCPQCSPHRKPGHQKEKDLAVNIEKGTWFCHHCGWSGGLNDSPVKAPRKVHKELPENVLTWFAKRGVSRETVKAFRIFYLPPDNRRAGAIGFPRYKNGRVVAVKYRTANKRMWQSPNPEKCFYNYDGALQAKENTLIITEGEIDAMSWYEAGYRAVVSVPDGAPPANAKNLDRFFAFLDMDFIDRFEHVILATDNDEPGQALRENLALAIGAHRCYWVAYPAGCKDTNDVLVAGGVEAVRRLYETAKPIPIEGLYEPEDVYESLLELYREGLKPGISTGWKSLDRYYTVRPGQLTVITGIPGSGKSTFLDALAINLFKNFGWRFAFCSPENWPIQRHLASLIEKYTLRPFAYEGYTAFRVTEEQIREAVSAMQGHFFFTQLQEKHLSIDGVLGVMQAAASRYGVNGVILDPWNELEYHRPTNLTETEFVSEALGKIRRFARLNNVHVWIVAHPTKLAKREDGTYPVPRLYDISGSAHFYNKPDNGISIYRPDPRYPEVQIHVQKIRFREIGQLGSVILKFARDSGTYLEITEAQREKDDIPF